MTPQVALITGASSGIGRAAALVFVKHNLHVAGVARRSDRLAELRAEVEALPNPHGEFLPIEGDVTQAESMQAAVQQTMERFGRLDVLIANAGVGYRGAVVEAEWDDLNTLLRTNIDGVLHSIRAAAPAMRQTGGGHIIVISSVTYNLVSPYAAPYAASKAFVTSLAHSLRLELDGRMALAQVWDAVTSEQTGGIEKVKFPIRLGDRQKLRNLWLSEDGLVGFFLNRNYGEFFPAFGLEGRNDDYSRYQMVPQISIAQPLDLTLLMDPSRGFCDVYAP